ncbi:hypothetical protein [Bdellovibrio sp. KM01]|uniref:hypothetical protein n=1 Tax=Bdellovibrio sp. KM01 TaxID=2748865 RepID=UPI0015EABD9B|nr:hypothetical protein [Bdellovibrio sp. KM01]QLY25781.1 hypothetical protein HW988_01670 [Bdellovibrio sp. KM01]
MKFRICAALTLSLILSACATSGGRRQIIQIRSNSPGAKVFLDDQLLGQAPLLAEIPRKSSLQLNAVDGKSKASTELDGHYRWGRSFAGNLGFLSWAPVGWATDLLTGAAWEYQDDVNLDFSESQQGNYQPAVFIAIAPPIATHPNIADEVGRLISADLSTKQTSTTVLPYNQTLSVFNDHDMDNDDQGVKSDRYEAAYHLKASKIYLGTVDISSDSQNVLVKGQLQDVLNPAESKSMDFAFDKSLTPSIYEVGWTDRSSEVISLLPNSIFIIPASGRTSLTINEQNVSAEEVSSEGFVEKTTQYLAAISLKNFLPPSKRKEWRYHFRLTPSLSFSYAREQFNDIPALKDVQFKRFHTDAGWGPSFNYGNNRYNLYLNIFPTVGYDSITTEKQGRDYREDSLGVTVGLEVGAMLFFKERWSIQVFSRSATVPEGMWSNIISDVTNTPTTVDSAAFVAAGFALGYTFPNKDLPF